MLKNYSSIDFTGIASNLRDLQMGHWSMYFVKLTEVYAIPHSPQILRFLLNFPIIDGENVFWLKPNSSYFSNSIN